jgi:hypothetical protein
MRLFTIESALLIGKSMAQTLIATELTLKDLRDRFNLSRAQDQDFSVGIHPLRAIDSGHSPGDSIVVLFR